MQRLGFRVARSPLGRWLAGWVFAHASFALPVERLHETQKLIAFYHPQPAYPLHILLVPKKAIPGLAELDPQGADSVFTADLLETVQRLVDAFDLEQAGYRLIVNGGAYQDVPQLHFHLVSGTPI